MTEIMTQRLSVDRLSHRQLYVLIAEEAGEIVQCAAKCLRFGLDSHHPDRPTSNNLVELLNEFRDLAELVVELDNRHGMVLADNRPSKKRLVYGGGIE